MDEYIKKYVCHNFIKYVNKVPKINFMELMHFFEIWKDLLILDLAYYKIGMKTH